MKTAQELRVGNVVMINNTPMVILKSEYSKGGRGASTVKLKMKNLLSNGGTVLMSRLNTGAITNGNLYEFDTMIACVIGGVSMTGGKGKIWQAFFGAIFLMEFFNGMNMMNVNSFMQDALKGIILVGAVLLDIARNKKR